MRPCLVVFTDLDATLLDEETYGYEAAAPALQELRRLGAPLVLCTGRTRAEVEPLHREGPRRRPGSRWPARPSDEGSG